MTRKQIDEILETQSYAAAKAAADKADIIWFASAGAAKRGAKQMNKTQQANWNKAIDEAFAPHLAK